MRIICFTESLAGGGAEHQMVILAGLLAEEGYDVTLVTYASVTDHYDTPPNVMRIDIGKTRIKNKWLKALIKILKIFHYFLRVKTDCIIAYRECANLRVLLPMIFRRRKIKVICSDRNTSTHLTFKHKLLLYYLYFRADYIVPNSQTETNFIAEHKPSLKSKLRTIHNFTDLNHFELSPIPVDISVIKVAIFSRYDKQKNPVGLAFAIHKLKTETKRLFEIHWYGAQLNESSGYLEVCNVVDKLDIADSLFLHPAVKNPASLMKDYHAICLPSLFEGFSNSIGEGICSGKPMLVSNVSDNHIMVKDGYNGFLFNPKDTDSICNAFLQFFNLTYEEMFRMGQNSRIIAENLFNKKQFVKRYIDLIES